MSVLGPIELSSKMLQHKSAISSTWRGHALPRVSGKKDSRFWGTADVLTHVPLSDSANLSVISWHIVGKVSRLTITEAFPEDDGEYKCMASNTAGQSVTTGDLTVTRKYNRRRDMSRQQAPPYAATRLWLENKSARCRAQRRLI